MSIIQSISNQKGGVGKTTTSAALSSAIANHNKHVLLVDLDPQANLTMMLANHSPDTIPITVADVLSKVIDDRPISPGEGIIKINDHIDLLPSNIQLSGLETSLVNAMSRENILKTYLNEIKHKYDYVIIDCMPSLGMLTINALAASDSVIIPVQPHFLSAKGLELLLRTIGKVRRQINSSLKVDGILMTMVDKRTNFTREIMNLLQETYGDQIRIFKSEIPISIRAVEASADGKLNRSAMDAVMMEPKVQQPQIVIKQDRISKYFPRDVTPQQMEETIIKLLENWYRKRNQEVSGR